MDNKTVQKTSKSNDGENKKLKEEIEKLKKEKDEYKNSYLRALADYHNLEKRIQEEKANLAQMAQAQLILKFLPFSDNLEKAQEFVKDEGLKLIKDNFLKALQEAGLEEVIVLGKPFDPRLCEAIDVVEGNQDNIVVEVLRKGYMFGGKVLRAAQVKVSKKKL